MRDPRLDPRRPRSLDSAGNQREGGPVSLGMGRRIDRLQGRIGWRLTKLRDQEGREMTVSSLLLIDAWLHLQLTGAAPDLDPRISQFLAGAVLRPSDGDVLLTLRQACRAIHRSPHPSGPSRA